MNRGVLHAVAVLCACLSGYLLARADDSAWWVLCLAGWFAAGSVIAALRLSAVPFSAEATSSGHTGKGEEQSNGA